METIRRLVRFALVLIVSLGAFASSAPAQAGKLDEARARWERLSPEEQSRMRERFEHLRTMPEPARASLEDRARSLADAMRRVEERLPAEVRARVEKLDPELRRALVRDLALLEGGDRPHAHGAMPEGWREKLERMPPEQRARMVAEFERKSREHGREKIADLLSKRYGLSATEIARIEALPESERMAEIAKLRRTVDASGQPCAPDEARGPEGRESLAARMKLLDAARARASDHLRYADLATGLRRELVAKIVRERVMLVVRGNELATPDEIAALEALSLDDFQRTLRDRLRMKRGRHGERPDEPRRR